MLRQIEWGVENLTHQKERGYATKYFVFLKFHFGIRTLMNS